jgi:putative redox protein
MGIKTVCRHLENYQVQVISSGHAWIVDEPPNVGGDDTGPNPFDLLLGGLGACMTLTVAHFAAQGNIPLEKLWIDLEGGNVGEGKDKQYRIDITINVRGDLGDKDLKRLKAYSSQCPVHALLDESADIRTDIRHVD